MAGELVRQSYREFGPDIREITFHCLCDDSDGSLTDTEMTDKIYRKVQGWSLDSVQTVPGSTAPDEAAVAIKDENGMDVLGGNGATLIHATDAQATVPNVDGQNKRIPMRGRFTLSISNQVTASAIFKVILVFVRMV